MDRDALIWIEQAERDEEQEAKPQEPRAWGRCLWNAVAEASSAGKEATASGYGY
eukprot:CAMPEP_0198121076 /NCGR_PEP_ID=MMETSP1442-20131203/31135_1 /TAXON_ID= /ORGANISM="Craspedostauros australis, Strain CCMP3328" /LENGTH=53 /DNA_ID=CAMNT_0043779833 /DNA_START=207 /DNA_END=369 /DNA_ORIENTATION=-